MKTFEIEFAFNDAFGFSIKHQNGKGEIGGGSLSEQFNKIIQDKGYDKKIALKTYCGKFVLSVPYEQAVANSAKLFDLFSAFKDILWNQYASGTTPADFTVYMLIYDGYSLAKKQIFSSIEYRNDEKHSALSVDEFLASVNELLGIEAQKKGNKMKKEKLIEMVNLVLQSELKGDAAHDYEIKELHLERNKDGWPCKLVIDFDTSFSMPPRAAF